MATIKNNDLLEDEYDKLKELTVESAEKEFAKIFQDISEEISCIGTF